MKKLTPRYFQEPVQMGRILQVEENFGYCFPKEFIQLTATHDALTPVENIFDFVDYYGDKVDRDLNFLSFNPLYPYPSDQIENAQYVSNKEEYGIANLVAFGFCGNGDSICFDYRENPKGNNPKIVLVYHDDILENEDGENSFVVNFVAENFVDFINSLYSPKSE